MFSGRPDPAWPVTAAAAEEIARLADALPCDAEADRPEAAVLGYRGSWLRAPDGREWRAGGGVVIRAGDICADPAGAIERAILETAPEGVLPRWAPPAG